MKIIELRFKNLNSLYGAWVIDFSAPEYLSDGIFALIGPTGAGKSTILDAICLALYGTTPRLGKITKSGNEIMSRQTGECYAEVTFESQAGRFRCHWSQHRARKKPDGNLIDSKHEIADALSGQILESKKRDVAGAIEDKTGMDFDQFTRSILLAQGGFDTFLKANVEQKSKILEQITGTQIYTEISLRIHERQRDERDKLNMLQAETSGILILTREQEEDVNLALIETKDKEAVYVIKIQERGKAIIWIKGINELNKEITSLAEESVTLNTMFETFKPDRKRLGRAQKAAELEGVYATLTSSRKQQSDDKNSLDEVERQFPKLETLIIQKEKLFKDAELITAKAKKGQKLYAPLIQKVRILDQQVTDKKKMIDTGKEDYSKSVKVIETDKKLLKQVKTKLETGQNELKAVQKYCKENAHDELLISWLDGIREQLRSFKSVQDDIAEKNRALVKVQKKMKSSSKILALYVENLSVHKKELDNAQKLVHKQKQDLNELLGERFLREYRTEKETFMREMVFLSKIGDLESERTKLEDGKPCPLCGADIHPYAIGNVPKTDEVEKKIDVLTKIINKAEQFEAKIKKFEDSEKSASEKMISIGKLEVKASNEKKNSENALIEIKEELTKKNERLAGEKQITLNKLQPLGIENIPNSNAVTLLTFLENRLAKWRNHQQKREKIEQHIFELNSELKRLDAVIKIQWQSLSEKESALDIRKKEHEGQAVERNKLFGSKNPDSEEANMEKAVADAEQAEKIVLIGRDDARQLFDSIKVKILSLKERIAKGVLELKISETDFVKALKTVEFTDEQKFVENLLIAKEREQLVAQAKQLDDQNTALQSRIKDRKSRLSLEVEKKLTESGLEELEPENREAEGALKLLRDDISGFKHKLTENKVAKEKIKDQQALIEAQKDECSRWEKLHGLIGSSDGKKYRNFAQGLTFELMVSHANRQLEKMTDRYLLIRDQDRPLELNVVDNYQAGEIRSTKNLSGGESFIVSLTLALGLSKMASRKVRVDSLFLDEGFGTLDDEALETALETLAGLQQDGKLIGIISHVSALKERIGTQISINPQSGGKSMIAGPGCSRVKISA